MITPGKYNRPLITDGHEASSTGHDGPNSSPAGRHLRAERALASTGRPLAAGHQSPSPSHMKGGGEYPSVQGAPTQLNYAVMEKEKARQALMQMHEHLSRQFPEACPIDLDATPVQPETPRRPADRGHRQERHPGTRARGGACSRRRGLQGPRRRGPVHGRRRLQGLQEDAEEARQEGPVRQDDRG